MKAQELPKTETLFHWQELDSRQKVAVLAAHASLSNDRDTLERLFELGKPTIVMGTYAVSENGKSVNRYYCRIADESVEVMKIITKAYL